METQDKINYSRLVVRTVLYFTQNKLGKRQGESGEHNAFFQYE